MIVECPQLTAYRDSCTLGQFVKSIKRLRPGISSVKIYAQYLSDIHPEDIHEKAMCLFSMKTAWDQLIRLI